MASTSASSIQKSFKYDVFLSFRGEDTRKNFVDHLYHALNQRGIYTYRDDEEIKKGKRISDELIRSIEDSRFYIIVFSKNYASSSWCLGELVKIMECQKRKEHTAYAVFYDVEPTEVRKQSGELEEAFAKNKEEDDAEKWRNALTEAANLAGWELKNTFNGHEGKLIQTIVQEISQALHFIHSSIDETLVGMDTRVQMVVSMLDIGSNDVRFIGIKGMGGAGKTTLARVVYNQISFQFEGSSFVENVRECSKDSQGLKSLQKQVLSNVLKTQDIIIDGVLEGKEIMKRRMCGIKVLVVLDDVDHMSQLEALAGDLNWFKPGSRVIITTREEQVLVAHKVPKNLILSVNMLSNHEAICLFSRYAFGRETPIKGYEELSNQVVRYAAGLPLTIKVLGSDLCGKGELEWIDTLERLKTIPLKETLNILEISYNSLEEDHKEIFLDVACMLKGWPKEKAIRMLESCGFNARIGLTVLELKSLITVSDSGRLGTHDHIEEMGRNIVRRVHPDQPYKLCRMWIKKELEDLQVIDKGATRCLKVGLVNMKGLQKIKKALENMKKLRFLDVTYTSKKFTDFYYENHFYRYVEDQPSPHIHLRYSRWKDYPFKWVPEFFQANNLFGLENYIPNSLQYLSLNGYPYKCLPKYFEATNLVGLEMVYSNIEHLWKHGEKKVPKKLRFLVLCFCNLKTLDIGMLVNLEMLSLDMCWSLVELHMPAETFKLKYLELSEAKLSTLNLVHANNLETLIVAYCEELVVLHMPIELKHFTFKGSNWKTLKLTQTPNLVTLHLVCKELIEFHIHQLPLEKLKDLVLQCSKMKTLDLSGTRNLETLDLAQCDNLQELHMSIENVKLKTIDISSSKLRTLNLTGSRHLNRLNLEQCEGLAHQKLIESPDLETINIRCSTLTTLNLTGTRNIRSLNLVKCKHLLELHMPIESPELKTIHVFCSNIKTLDLRGTRNLESLDLGECAYLQELNMPIESYKLKTASLCCSKLRTLDLSGTRNLERLDLAQCEDLIELHMSTENVKLKTIDIGSSKLEILKLTGTRHLNRLNLEQCEDLAHQKPIERSELETINIRCSMLRTLNLTKTRNIKSLNLVQCEDLLELHMPIESPELKTIDICCSKLTTLDLSGTGNLERLDLAQFENLVELRMPNESPKLTIINMGCSKLRTLYLGISPYLECLNIHDWFTLEEISAPVGCMSGHVRFIPIWVSQVFPMVGSSAELHLKARSIGICTLHPDNNMPKFYFECAYRELLPLSTRNLERLITFGLCPCTNLVSLSERLCGLQHLRKLTLVNEIPNVPKEIEQLECLEELSLLSTKIEYLPDSICALKNLKFVEIKSCQFLKKLPEDIGRLECLEELHLTDCTSLRDIPNSICEMKRLKCFRLTNCILVEKLPKEMGRLTCLKELNIQGTSITDMPESIFELKDLRFFV